MRFVDTHVHLDSEAFEDDLESVLSASREAGVTRWINVGYNRDRWASTEKLVRAVDGMRCMLGLHPGDADAWSESLLSQLRRLVVELRPVAIGEAGIDLYWRQDNLSMQESALRAQLALAKVVGLPLVIHMRDADDELLDVLERESELPHLHFHSFDGNEGLRGWVTANNSTIGVGGLLTRRGSGELKQWVAELPREKVVLETDAPYLKPRGIRGKRNEPAYVVRVAQLLGELWSVDLAAVASITTENAERIFQLDKEVD